MVLAVAAVGAREHDLALRRLRPARVVAPPDTRAVLFVGGEAEEVRPCDERKGCRRADSQSTCGSSCRIAGSAACTIRASLPALSGNPAIRILPQSAVRKELRGSTCESAPERNDRATRKRSKRARRGSSSPRARCRSRHRQSTASACSRGTYDHALRIGGGESGQGAALARPCGRWAYLRTGHTSW